MAANPDMVFLRKLIPDGQQTPLSPDLSGYAPAHRAWYQETLAELPSLIAAGRIKPVVAEHVLLAEAARAHEQLERDGYAGKVILITNTG